jgi:hypothetical protein
MDESNSQKSLISNQSKLTRAKFFKINSPDNNYTQYVATIRAYALAGMPFAHIANAGDSIGDIIERGEMDAPVIEGWQEKIGEVAEGQSKVLAWQNRHEVISINYRIPGQPQSITNQEAIIKKEEIVQTLPDINQDINVLEGISVFKNSATNNPYLTSASGVQKL